MGKKTKRGSEKSSVKSALADGNKIINQDLVKNHSLEIAPKIQNLPQSQEILERQILKDLLAEKDEKSEKNPDLEKIKKENHMELKKNLDPIQAMQSRNIDEKTTAVRAGIASFAQQIKESIKNYKPPISRLSLDLNPKELGKIELTLTQRGKDLQVSITSNAQAITLFAQNQDELRQNLQNLGFSQVDMSFSSQSNQENRGNGEQGKQKRNKNGLQAYNEINHLTDATFDSMEIVLPKYI